MVLQRRQLDPDQSGARLNLLVSYGGWRPVPVVDQVVRLLEPLGICGYRAHSGEEAADLIEHQPIHIAVVDLDLPLRAPTEQETAPPRCGERILELLRRLEAPPPTVVVRSPQPTARESARELGRALREGVFTVVDRPVQLETMLEILRRIVRRYYADHWPANQ